MGPECQNRPSKDWNPDSMDGLGNVKWVEKFRPFNRIVTSVNALCFLMNACTGYTAYALDTWIHCFCNFTHLTFFNQLDGAGIHRYVFELHLSLQIFLSLFWSLVF